MKTIELRSVLAGAVILAVGVAASACSEKGHHSFLPPPPQQQGPPAPSSLSYGAASFRFGVPGTDIAPLTPTSGGGAPTSHAITPSLPPGLSFDGSTGVISGRPTASGSITSYQVTASNAGGSTTATFTLHSFDASVEPGARRVDIQSFTFVDSTGSGSATTVQRGTVVTWVNLDAAQHFAQSTDTTQAWADVASYGQGGKQLVAMNRAGAFPYRCGVHNSMLGSVTVNP